jgi:signal transduction histidine kinase
VPQAGPRTSWPGSLVERALALLLADYRRPAGPIAIATVLAVAAVLGRADNEGPFHPPLAIVLGLLATVPIAIIRRYPAFAIGAMLTASAAFVAFGRLSWSAAAVAGWLIALAACPVLLSRRRAVLAVMLTEGAVLLATLNVARNATPWDATIAEALAVIAAWGAGELLRARRQSALDQAAAAEQVRHLSERDAVARERASIARELHDVVAHHVSMIAVRAATAPYAISGLPAPGEAAFGEIAEEARTALTELRVVLGVLRAPGRAAEGAPQPRLADLDCLLSRMAGAGTDVAMTAGGTPRPLPASVELCGYRVVQEALTNAGRHAPGSTVRVDLGYQPDALSVRVSNGQARYPVADALGGAGRPAAASTAGLPGAAGLAGQGWAATPSGYGLTGLRERVEMLGGQFGAGPDGQGGFLVTALLPVPAEGGPR